MEYIAIGALSLALAGTTWKWAMARLEANNQKYVEECLHEDIAELKAQHAREMLTAAQVEALADNFIRDQGRRIAEYRAAEQRRNAQRRAAGDKGRATQTAKRIDKETQAKLIQQARHSEMRELVALV